MVGAEDDGAVEKTIGLEELMVFQEQTVGKVILQWLAFDEIKALRLTCKKLASCSFSSMLKRSGCLSIEYPVTNQGVDSRVSQRTFTKQLRDFSDSANFVPSVLKLYMQQFDDMETLSEDNAEMQKVIFTVCSKFADCVMSLELMVNVPRNLLRFFNQTRPLHLVRKLKINFLPVCQPVPQIERNSTMKKLKIFPALTHLTLPFLGFRSAHVLDVLSQLNFERITKIRSPILFDVIDLFLVYDIMKWLGFHPKVVLNEIGLISHWTPMTKDEVNNNPFIKTTMQNVVQFSSIEEYLQSLPPFKIVE